MVMTASTASGTTEQMRLVSLSEFYRERIHGFDECQVIAQFNGCCRVHLYCERLPILWLQRLDQAEHQKT
jgi:hypothetical protein